jgi:hypothetical protein
VLRYLVDEKVVLKGCQYEVALWGMHPYLTGFVDGGGLKQGNEIHNSV